MTHQHDTHQGGWIGIDLDGTLAHYDDWQGIDQIGPPIHKTVEFVKDLLAKGWEVRIMTARVGPQRGGAEDIVHAIQAIRAWCMKHIGQDLRVTAEKDLAMVWLYDDRATRVEKNTGVWFDPGHLYTGPHPHSMMPNPRDEEKPGLDPSI